jgi:hypothetical protein
VSLLQSIDKQMRLAIGQGVRAISDYWDVYRLSDLSTGQVISDPNKVITRLQARLCFNTPKPLIESEPLDNLLYSGMLDTSKLQIGDVLLHTGPGGIPNNLDGRAFTLVDVRPLMAPLFVRTEIMSYISRPHEAAIGDEPLLGDGGHVEATKFTEAVLMLTDGLYSFSNAPGTPAVIPLGFHQHRRTGSNQEEAKYLPTATPRAVYYAYLPPLPGVHLNPGDIIADSTGNRFRLTTVHTWTTGLQGSMGIMESLFV